ncbi:MAG TPA: helix-turn-helix domain-containing protein [Thermodesulfovibrionales bacterium]|nr:helix-turn-helix domain-containing protein [Thermodesulfovibrionales bacterium]
MVWIRVPPLREKKDDIPILVEAFLKEFCVRERKMLRMSDEVMSTLYEYSWPGNIRQLRNVIERAVVMATRESIMPGDLPEEFNAVKEHPAAVGPKMTLREMELQAIKNSLQKCEGNKSKAAKMLGISRKALYKRLNEEECIQ